MNKYYNTDLTDYKEAKALDQLLKLATDAMQTQAEEDAQSNFTNPIGQFTITIGGVQTAFMLGGPQYDGVLAFITHIAYENGYMVDLDRLTVEE